MAKAIGLLGEINLFSYYQLKIKKAIKKLKKNFLIAYSIIIYVTLLKTYFNRKHIVSAEQLRASVSVINNDFDS